MSKTSEVMAFGDPEAIYCRWCKAARSRLNKSTWYCRTCDGPLHLVRGTPPEPTPA